MADRIDEVVSEKTVDMRSALPRPEALFYAGESNVAEWGGKSAQLLKGLEEHYGFPGGYQEEWAKYLCRPDLPPRLWTYVRRADIEAPSGVSAAPKKDFEKLRKLVMDVRANYVWRDVKPRENHGLG